jgi:hypothetical protein
VALDASQFDPVLGLLNKLFMGTSLQAQKIEAWSLLRDIAREYAGGSITEAELEEYVGAIAKRLSTLLASAGKGIPLDALKGELMKAVLDAAGRDMASLALDIRARMTRRRERRRLRSEIESLL